MGTMEHAPMNLRAEWNPRIELTFCCSQSDDMHVALQTRMLLARTQSLCETQRALLDELKITYQQLRLSRLTVLCTRDALRQTRRQRNQRRRQLSVLSSKLKAEVDSF